MTDLKLLKSLTKASLLSLLCMALFLPTLQAQITPILHSNWVDPNDIEGEPAAPASRYCSTSTLLSASSGTFSDGSGSSSYDPNTVCSWLIAPTGATQINLRFTSFYTESTFDHVTVYDGPSPSSQIIGRYSGSSLPGTLLTTPGIGSMLIVFETDGSLNLDGWHAFYSSTSGGGGGSGHCSGLRTLTTTGGTLSDGSGAGSYRSNSYCRWLITPANANQVFLVFTAFETELNFDEVSVYDGSSASSPLIGTYSGSSLPPNLSTTPGNGSMYVVFESDASLNFQGWSATYSSSSGGGGGGSCSGLTTLTAKSGTFSDGSGSNDYQNDLSCQWLIAPDDADHIELRFLSFETEESADEVSIYAGENTSAPLIAEFSGDNLPHGITTASGLDKLLIRFTTDATIDGAGWTAAYNSYATDIEVPQVREPAIKIYPNPNHGAFTIESEFSADLELRIVDLMGRNQLEEHISVSSGEQHIDGLNLAEGIYLIQFEANGELHSQKLIIQ